MRFKKILCATNLTTKATFTAPENKILNLSNLVKKTDYTVTQKLMKKKEIITDYNCQKYIATYKLHKLASEVFFWKISTSKLSKKKWYW